MDGDTAILLLLADLRATIAALEAEVEQLRAALTVKDPVPDAPPS